jgi:hypothetical protein
VQQWGNGGFLLKHRLWVQGNAQVNVPLTYTDYYYVEVLERYRALIRK